MVSYNNLHYNCSSFLETCFKKILYVNMRWNTVEKKVKIKL